ncbi:MAG: DNA mismatch repair endonuclease MutL [Ignavibacteriae bacterium]|nr:DNA mismatch repair endonuclease MutL [Ignavibacteriota bacterium]
MHHKVQVLSEHLANQIAAGEVIQRPESVVKELLENSLDAEAKHLLILIKEGGKKVIQIVDDGMGMDEADAVASFLRHATSKIASLEDLEGILTYGFRGEALASIAAVAQVTMKTRRADADAAVVVQIDGGGMPRISREGREVGTSISVQNLFFNVPARRKFLKSNSTEFRHIYEVVQRVALSHPAIALKFISDDEVILDLPPGALHDRLLDIFGQRQVESMVWTEERTEYAGISGYIGKPTFGQKSRVNQYLFLNGRFITNRNINHAVFSAYENLLIKGTFPFFLLFIEIDPHRVDVNVHPSKMEAKFEDEQSIYRFVGAAVRRALAANNLMPAMSAASNENDPAGIGLQFTNRQHSWPSRSEFIDRATGEIIQLNPSAPHDQQQLRFERTSVAPANAADGKAIVDQLFRSAGERDSEASPAMQSAEADTATAQNLPFLWQLHNKYILAPIENGLLVVDQHVAHERILYELALRRFETKSATSQQLLFPETLQLTPGDSALVQELLPHFEMLGFTIKPFGGNTIVLEGIPADIKAAQGSHIIQDLLSLYKEYTQHGNVDARDNLAKSYSCKAAIKAGDPLSIDEMRSLLTQLFATRMPYVCPHGRPVVLKISTDEFDRRFGRTS